MTAFDQYVSIFKEDGSAQRGLISQYLTNPTAVRHVCRLVHVMAGDDEQKSPADAIC
ncbi:hypothetical protein ANCDUO_04388 [Ancylostoma duodenale]|uniref:Uncharacterized protein n=1 Tax=Ancylostoma duodenale TaxID=51022 RepID=A0A0C2GV38_9BILA|nr:hypothetical protein ANCDUO_04388 [Ancylostoma duodenale]